MARVQLVAWRREPRRIATQHIAIFEDQWGEPRDIRRRNGKAFTMELVKDHFHIQGVPFVGDSRTSGYSIVLQPFISGFTGRQRLERDKQWADPFCPKKKRRPSYAAAAEGTSFVP
jgi:hypothetical protein